MFVFATNNSDPEKKARVLMKNIRVIRHSEVIQSNPARICVFLEVTPDEAKLLKAATVHGSVSLGLVGEADTKNEKALLDRKGDPTTPKKGNERRLHD